MRDDDVMPLLLARRAQETPDRIFALEPDGPSKTFLQMHESALTWSAVLRALGVGAGDTVLLMVPTSVEAVAAWIGVAWLRGLEVPINTQYRGDMLKYAFNDSKAKVAIVDPTYLEHVAFVVDECPELETVIILGETSGAPDLTGRRVLDGFAVLADAEPLSPDELKKPTRDDIGSIIYTSGTTGPSKGVLVPWGQSWTMSHWCPPVGELTPDDRLYAPFPFFHNTIKSPTYAMLQCGGSLVLQEKFSSKTYWDTVRRYDCTVGLLLGGMARLLNMAEPREDDVDVPMRRVLMVPAIPDIVAFGKRFGLKAGTMYGMTELSTPLITLDYEVVDPASCGRPRPGVQLRLVDRSENDVPAGEVGELLVRTDEPWAMNKGYWNKPEATQAAWRDGWFHTGDAMRRDENDNYYYVDRFKDAIRRRGENISSVEVENIVNTYPGVEAAAAFGVPAELGDEEVMVVVQTLPGKTFDEQELIDYLQPRMAPFMLPRYVELVEQMPMTLTQKIRKADLRKRGVSERTWDRLAQHVPGKI